MPLFYKPKRKPGKRKRSAGSQPVRVALEHNARVLLRTDLQLHRARDRSDTQISQFEALHLVGTLINSTFDLEEIFQGICDSLVRDLDFEKAGLVFLDDAGQKPQQSAYAGFTSAEFASFLNAFQGIIQPSLRAGEVRLRTRIHAQAEWAALLTGLDLESLLLVPLLIKSRVIGCMLAGRTRTTLCLSDRDRQFYQMYGSQASTAIENARLYEALGQANLTLEERVRGRTKDLIDANERLRELDTIKSNFISLVSHELRTPLTSIKGFASTLLQFDSEISAEKRVVYLKVLNEETDRLTRLISDLLDVSRIESGRMELQRSPVSIPEVVERVFKNLAIRAGSLRLVAEFPADFPTVAGDPDKLEQVFVNLVSNGVKFSPPTGTITVRGRFGTDDVIVEVVDEGPGIAFAEQEKVFDKFFRSDNEINSRNPGTGLGLPISRALVNLHGGKIWVESEPGKGSHFFFRLPRHGDSPQTFMQGAI